LNILKIKLSIDILSRQQNLAQGDSMEEIFIVSAARTAIGAYGAALKDVPVVNLGALVIREVLKKAGLRPVIQQELAELGPDIFKGSGMTQLEQSQYQWDPGYAAVQIDGVIMGNVLPAGQGQNISRQASMYAGIPKETTAFTVNKLCASGMMAIGLGYQAILSRDADVVIAGGMENMSRVPYAFPAGRWGARMGNQDILDLLIMDGLQESFYGYHMGMTAENIAEKYGISRQEQDELGLLSHLRAPTAMQKGAFREEIVPVMLPQKKGDPIAFARDERPMETSLEKMAKLAPAFKPDGTVTAGNSSGINDAAAAVLLMSKAKAREFNLQPLGKIRAFATGGVDPAYMGLGPIPAVRKLLKKTGVSMGQIGRIELNEAFAAQAIACMRELGCDLDKTNVCGSGISLGHPVGCTGARIVVTLLHGMQPGSIELGLATLCTGGGQGMALLVEAV
jgi:acetyl-CoA C-acetyltransferase